MAAAREPFQTAIFDAVSAGEPIEDWSVSRHLGDMVVSRDTIRRWRGFDLTHHGVANHPGDQPAGAVPRRVGQDHAAVPRIYPGSSATSGALNEVSWHWGRLREVTRRLGCNALREKGWRPPIPLSFHVVESLNFLYGSLFL